MFEDIFYDESYYLFTLFTSYLPSSPVFMVSCYKRTGQVFLVLLRINNDEIAEKR